MLQVVHAKGAGAHGIFTPTKDLSNITMAHPFQPDQVGKEIPVTMRFSTVGGESGSADTARDPRGFAIKLKTEVGNWDWTFNNTPGDCTYVVYRRALLTAIPSLLLARSVQVPPFHPYAEAESPDALEGCEHVLGLSQSEPGEVSWLFVFSTSS